MCTPGPIVVDTVMLRGTVPWPRRLRPDQRLDDRGGVRREVGRSETACRRHVDVVGLVDLERLAGLDLTDGGRREVTVPTFGSA
jgi:hypothetical protein